MLAGTPGVASTESRVYAIPTVKTWTRCLAAGAVALLAWRGAQVHDHRPLVPVRPPATRPGHVDSRALIHVHSNRSGDGRAELPEIVDAAIAAGVQVVYLTDHDTQGYALTHQEGWYRGVLVLAGIETRFFDTDHGYWGTGHMLILGAKDLPEPIGKMNWPEVIALGTRCGGLTFIAHATTPRVPWRGGTDGITGAEMINLFSGYDANPPWQLLGGALLSLLNPVYGARLISGGETGELAYFDAWAARQRMVGIGGADAHANIPISAHTQLAFPSMQSLFSVMSTHLVLRGALDPDTEHARAQVLAALREGRAYVSWDCLADPTGFAFVATDAAGEHEMGEEVRGDVTLRLTAPEVPGVHVRLLLDGLPVASAEGPSLSFSPVVPGAYRAEAWVRHSSAFFGLPEDDLWITSNPIYLRH